MGLRYRGPTQPVASQTLLSPLLIHDSWFLKCEPVKPWRYKAMLLYSIKQIQLIILILGKFTTGMDLFERVVFHK